MCEGLNHKPGDSKSCHTGKFLILLRAQEAHPPVLPYKHGKETKD